MGDIDPDTLLEWLTMGQGEERDMQLIALEQLCMLLLMSDNVDRCFESCPPRTFLPALCHIFMDDTAPDNILEVTARAITDYLDVSAECSRRIVSVEGAVKALCTRLLVTDISSRTSKDLAEQVVKLLELMCTREAGALYDAGGLGCMLTFIREYGSLIHKDTLHSAMSVVARLCTKIEPTDTTLQDCVDSLSKLLQHADTYVADGALKCFACLSDRFARKNVDPSPLAEHGLTDALLQKLGDAATSSSDRNQNVSSGDSGSSSGNISIIISVLSTLCRGSAAVTHSLLRSDLIESIRKAMKGDERCVLDTMRLVDLLLLLLFEGRDALPKSSFAARNGIVVFNQMDSNGDRSHRQLIDCIRSKDTDALIDAVESGNFEVNFMDDVGQTLLNWASAFGTLEMVEFLCDRGADVNRGQRSSSLHYAACFGRPAVARVLLRCGANPDLRDEDGKTPLDKARERNDEGHKEVASILQSPGDWMIQVTEQVDPDSKTKTTGQTEDSEEEQTVKGDPEMAPLYLNALLPIFAQTYLSSLIASIRKATLAVLKKIIHYVPKEAMSHVIPDHATASQLSEVVANVLSNEDDLEGHAVVFECIEDLLSKGQDMFTVHFIRLGVLSNITALADALEPSLLPGASDPDSASKRANIDSWVYEDAASVKHNEPYHWHDWCIVRGQDCLYLWSEFCAIELSNGSNGWFRFILDGKLATMYSSGSPEIGSGSSESRSEFLDKLQKAIVQVPSTMASRPILSEQGSPRIVVGNWSFNCQKDKQLHIHNADGQQTTVLKEELCGFVFESNRGTKHTFTAEAPLGPDFAAAWTSKPGKRFQTKKELLRQKLCHIASGVVAKYFKDVECIAVGNMSKLHEISEKLNKFSSQDQYDKMTFILKDLCQLMKKEAMLSSFEIQSSGLVSALKNCLNKTGDSPRLGSAKDVCDARTVFKSVFGEKGSMAVDSSDDTPAIVLVRKLVSVLEAMERLPVLAVDSSVNSGLQVLLRRLRFRLERNPKSNTLINHSGRLMKMEPLTTVGELQSYLSKMFAKQWHDFDRSSFKFVQDIKSHADTEPISFSYESDFDENGLIYWIGTNGKACSEWVNPARYGVVVVSCSYGRSLPYGKPEAILSRAAAALNCHTNDEIDAWFAIDLALWFVPSAYTLRHARGYGRSALRNWKFQASVDGQEWSTLRHHENDESLNDPGSTATWHLDLSNIEQPPSGWRMFRIQQSGPNASGKTYYLSLSGLELYGTVQGVCSDAPKSCLSEDSHVRRQRVANRSAMLRYMTLDCKDTLKWKLARDQCKRSGVKTEAFRRDRNDGWVEVSTGLSRLGPRSGLVKVKASGSHGDDVVKATSQDESQRRRDPTVSAVRNKAIRKRVFRPRNSALSNSAKDRHNSSRDCRRERSSSSDVVEQVLKFGSEPNERENDVQDLLEHKVMDMANLRLLLAVEDLLDNASSELVASALAEAASLDQLRAAANSLRSTFFDRKGGVTPSSQTSRESGSPRDTIDDVNSISVVVDDERTNGQNLNDFSQIQAELSSAGGSGSEDGCQSYNLVDSCGDGSESDAVDGPREGARMAMTTEVDAYRIDKSDAAALPDDSRSPAPPETTTSAESVANTEDRVDCENNEDASVRVNKEASDLSKLNAKNEGDTVDQQQPHDATPTTATEIANKRNERNDTPPNDNNASRGDKPPEVPVRLTLDSSERLASSDLPSPSERPLAYSQELEDDMDYATLGDDDDDDDDDDDVDFDDDEDYDDIVNDDFPDSDDAPATETQQKVKFVTERVTRHSWDDEFVLKREHSALVPAFDPRPGRVNVPQTQDIELPSSGHHVIEKRHCEQVRLTLRKIADTGHKPVDVALDNPNATIFSYILSLASMDTDKPSHGGDRLKRIWDPTYTLVYGTEATTDDRQTDSSPSSTAKWDVAFVEKNLGTSTLLKSEVVQYLQRNAGRVFLRKWRLYGTTRSCRKQRNCSQLLAAYKEFASSDHSEVCKEKDDASSDTSLKGEFDGLSPSVTALRLPFLTDVAPVEDVLQLLGCLHKLSMEANQRISVSDVVVFDVGTEEFLSKKLTNKLTQQLQDPLLVASGSLPLWCDHLVINYPMMFPFEARHMYFQATAFGCARAVVWLQGMHDNAMQRSRGHTPRRVDNHDFKIGRLKHERITVPRGDELLSVAVKLMDFHAGRKAVLEIEFKDEEGTGLGPSLEFYALVARELQRKSLAMWVTEESLVMGAAGESSPAHDFVVHPNGLFPAPLPQHGGTIGRACELFHFVGVLLAKCLQDNRLIDVPLCEPFLKILCAATSPQQATPAYCCSPPPLSPRPSASELGHAQPWAMDDSAGVMCSCWFKESFTDTDFELVHPHLFKFVAELRRLIAKAKAIRQDTSLEEAEVQRALAELQLETESGHRCHLDDLSLTFQYVPSSDVFGFAAVDLKPDGEDQLLNMDNVEEYVQLLSEFCMHKGIEKQLQAFHAGFNRVFPMEKLHSFTPLEVRRILSGEQTPQWSRDDLVNYTEPRYGYTRESAVFKMLVNVLDGMNGEERKDFLQFATGCSSLPPGGLANLHPRLTVVRKSGEGDGSYPSVNTCVHYLKLPEYTTEEVLRTKLLHATKEKGFHLN